MDQDWAPVVNGRQSLFAPFSYRAAMDLKQTAHFRNCIIAKRLDPAKVRPALSLARHLDHLADHYEFDGGMVSPKSSPRNHLYLQRPIIQWVSGPLGRIGRARMAASSPFSSTMGRPSSGYDLHLLNETAKEFESLAAVVRVAEHGFQVLHARRGRHRQVRVQERLVVSRGGQGGR